MFAKFASKVGSKNGRTERKYVLNEVLAILDMANQDDMDRETISKVTGRSKDSLNYKIFEGQTTIKGKTNVRSVRRFWYVDPKSKDSAMNDTHTAIRLLYKAYGVDASKLTDEQLEADVQERINAFAASIEANGPQTEGEGDESEEGSDEVAS